MDLGQNLGQVSPDVPDLPVVLKLAGRHLKPQVEQLLPGTLQVFLEIA